MKKRKEYDLFFKISLKKTRTEWKFEAVFCSTIKKARIQAIVSFVSQQGKFTLKCVKIKYAEL